MYWLTGSAEPMPTPQREIDCGVVVTKLARSSRTFATRSENRSGSRRFYRNRLAHFHHGCDVRRALLLLSFVCRLRLSSGRSEGQAVLGWCKRYVEGLAFEKQRLRRVDLVDVSNSAG